MNHALGKFSVSVMWLYAEDGLHRMSLEEALNQNCTLFNQVVGDSVFRGIQRQVSCSTPNVKKDTQGPVFTIRLQ